MIQVNIYSRFPERIYRDNKGVSYAEVNWEKFYWLPDWKIESIQRAASLLTNEQARDTGLLACKYLFFSFSSVKYFSPLYYSLLFGHLRYMHRYFLHHFSIMIFSSPAIEATIGNRKSPTQ